MTRFFVPLDVNYQFDDKISAVSIQAETPYVRSLAYAKRAATEGRLRTGHLAALSLKMTKPQRYAAELVEHGLWEATDDGWMIVGWLKHNPTNAQITADKENRKRKGQESAHTKYHVKLGAYEADCVFCNPPTTEGEPIGRPTPDPKVSDSNRREHEPEREHDNEREHEHEPSLSSAVGLKLVPKQPPDNDDRIEQAIELHALHESADKVKPKGYAHKIRTNDPIEHGPALNAYLERHPDATAAELACTVLGVPNSQPRPPAPEYPPCDDCGDSGRKPVWTTNSQGHQYSTTVEPCHCPRGQALKGTA